MADSIHERMERMEWNEWQAPLVNNLARHHLPLSSMIGASDRCAESHGLESRQGVGFSVFLCRMVVTCDTTKLKVHLSDLYRFLVAK